MNILQTYQQYIDTLSHLSQNTIQCNQVVPSLIIQYSNQTICSDEYIVNFLEFMSSRMGNNSYNLRLLNLKQFFHWCDDNDLYPYPKFIDKRYKKKTDPEFVTISDEERDLLKNYSGKWTDSAHNFYNMLYTGLHYQDYFNLKDVNFQKDGNGYRYIVANRQKTGIRFKIPIHTNIVDRIYHRPYISKAVFNRQLKLIFSQLGIDEDITLRNSKAEFVTRPKCEWVTISTARHSFATSALINNIPHNVIMQWCGWKSVAMIFLYSDRLGLETQTHMEKM